MNLLLTFHVFYGCYYNNLLNIRCLSSGENSQEVVFSLRTFLFSCFLGML